MVVNNGYANGVIQNFDNRADYCDTLNNNSETIRAAFSDTAQDTLYGQGIPTP
jgi:hypothetical protein